MKEGFEPLIPESILAQAHDFLKCKFRAISRITNIIIVIQFFLLLVPKPTSEDLWSLVVSAFKQRQWSLLFPLNLVGGFQYHSSNPLGANGYYRPWCGGDGVCTENEHLSASN